MFTEKDLQQIEKHGLTPDAVERQLENFRRGFPFLKVVRAASPGDGVMVVGDAEAAAAVARYEREAPPGHREIRASLGCRDPYVQGVVRVRQRG